MSITKAYNQDNYPDSFTRWDLAIGTPQYYGLNQWQTAFLQYIAFRAYNWRQPYCDDSLANIAKACGYSDKRSLLGVPQAVSDKGLIRFISGYTKGRGNKNRYYPLWETWVSATQDRTQDKDFDGTDYVPSLGADYVPSLGADYVPSLGADYVPHNGKYKEYRDRDQPAASAAAAAGKSQEKETPRGRGTRYNYQCAECGVPFPGYSQRPAPDDWVCSDCR